jgi:membrane protease YdiL (CAAX protease family)
MTPPAVEHPTSNRDRTRAYFALACGTTWALALPAALAWSAHRPPSPLAVGCAGLSAFGPTIAALVLSRPGQRLRQVFGRWRANPAWILAALAAAPLVHLVATALFAACGGHPTAWFHPPRTADAVAALVVFPLGEEPGWRGFAHPRLVDRFGPVRGCLLLGMGWALWHLAYAITPETAGFDLVGFGLLLLEIPLYALLVGWLFERTGRSLAVALAFHVGMHIDRIEPAARADLRLQLLHLLVLAAAAAITARLLGGVPQKQQLAKPAQPIR